MGNSTCQSSPLFLQTHQDPHFGQIDLYRNHDNTILMRSLCSHIAGEKRQKQFGRILEWVLNKGHPLVVPVLSRNSKVENNICVKYGIEELVTEYFNFTLEDLMAKKKVMEEGELWHLTYQLLTLIVTLKSNNFGMHFDPSHLFLTLKGQLAVYVHHLTSFQDSICSYSTPMGESAAKIVIELATGQKISSQSQLQDEQMELLRLLAVVCGRYWMLGDVLRKMMHREQPQHQILQQIQYLLSDGIIRKSNQIKLSKFRYILPQKSHPPSPSITRKQTQQSQQKERVSFSKTLQQKLSFPSNYSTNNEEKSVERSIKDIHREWVGKQKENYRLDTMMSQIDEKKQQNRAKMEALKQKKYMMASKTTNTHDKKEHSSNQPSKTKFQGKFKKKINNGDKVYIR